MPISTRSSERLTSTLPRHKADSGESDVDASFRLSGTAQRMQVLLETNALLEKMGFGTRSFDDYDDLVASVSSMGVALYEKLFQFHLEQIVRVPGTASDYIHNAQRVVDALSGALLDESFDTAQVTGASLCDGDVTSIQQLVRMFMQIYEILYNSSNSEQQHRDEGEGGDPLQQEREEEGTEAPPVDTATQRKTRSGHHKSATMRPARGTRATNSGKLHPAKHSELRTTRHVASQATSATAIKKRTRRPQHGAMIHASPTRNAKQTSTARADKCGKQKLLEGDTALEQQLLTTQRYGRFVPVPQQHRGHQEQPHDDVYEGVDDAELAQLRDDELAAGETYFGGVSSVSGASGSSASIHFMEEEGEFAQNFSTIQSHSSPGTTSKDSPDSSTPESQRDAAVRRRQETETKENTPQQQQPKKNKSQNQQDADADADDDRYHQQKHQQKQRSDSTSPLKASASLSPHKSLYPLLPETTRHEKESKARNHHLKYKIQLKDHLQELRHREFCQRQHLERAYRLGEHTANVERIRTRRFEQELRLQRIAIGLEAKTQEETQLRDAMHQLLHLEKQKLRDEHQTTKQMLRMIQSDHAEREQAMETFYATQMELIKEQTQREVHERETVEKAHRMASEQMLREMKREKERQVATLLTQKQHLANVRRFHHATRLTQAMDKGARMSARQGDAFYAAAMKARQLRALPKTENGATKTKTTKNATVNTIYGPQKAKRRV